MVADGKQTPQTHGCATFYNIFVFRYNIHSKRLVGVVVGHPAEQKTVSQQWMSPYSDTTYTLIYTSQSESHHLVITCVPRKLLVTLAPDGYTILAPTCQQWRLVNYKCQDRSRVYTASLYWSKPYFMNWLSLCKLLF